MFTDARLVRSVSGLAQPSGSPACDAGDAPIDVRSLSSDLVERLLIHPFREKRGAKEADKDTLLVRSWARGLRFRVCLARKTFLLGSIYPWGGETSGVGVRGWGIGPAGDGNGDGDAVYPRLVFRK